MTDSTKNTATTNDNEIHDYDVIIIGAGISGISAAYHIQKHFPNKSFRILEGRESLGGTWDFFEYPGIRCDSYMNTFGFGFRPWQHKDSKVIVEKEDLLNYLKDTVQEYELEKHMEFQTRVQTAHWDTASAKWTFQATRDSSTVTYRSQYVFMSTGYYNYDHGYQPEFPNQDAFQGILFHPQNWPKDLDYTNKRIVVIGSGATAVTLVPALAEKAQHVTMLQRSPTYILAAPSTGRKVSRFIAKYFGHAVCRWYFICISMLFYWWCRTFPERAKKLFLKMAKEEIGEDKFDPKHFTPRYNPWDERLCLDADGAFFAALKSGKAEIVTDHIQEFTKDGIRLRDCEEDLKADIIVSATGLDLLFAGGVQLFVDDNPLVINTKFAYKGFMADNVPNLFVCTGYTNASWTLKVDLTNQAACRLISLADKKGKRYFHPEIPGDGKLPAMPLLDLQSGYIQRNLSKMPKQSTHLPWRLDQNYLKDKYTLTVLPLEDGIMKFY